ncbi:ROK family protein [Candidatus Woesearchaeota archaeon]|nr:ROK family protein [Candidatus Woesearchaeota archaeon]
MTLVIGIDLGGSKIKGILVDEKGNVMNNYERLTESDNPRKEILANIFEVIDKLMVHGVEAVGFSTPGFELPNGKMTCMPNIKKLEGVKLRKELEKKTKLSVFLENDANCFALAEQRQGAAKGCKNVIGVIIGTGVGGGIIIERKIYRGAVGGAGEIGHTKLLVNNNNNNSELKEIEELISGPDLIQRYELLSGKRADSPAVLLDKKDEFARKVYDEFVFYTGVFFANLINTFNPDMIVVGGGVSNLPFYKEVEKIAKKYAHPELGRVCRIVKNKLGDDSGTIGAAELALDH